MMLCAGASEHAMSQWSSLFAERGLSVSKTMGDLLGPCAFAVLMGLSRLLYGLFGHRLKVRRAMALSAGVVRGLLSSGGVLRRIRCWGCWAAR